MVEESFFSACAFVCLSVNTHLQTYYYGLGLKTGTHSYVDWIEWKSMGEFPKSPLVFNDQNDLYSLSRSAQYIGKINCSGLMGFQHLAPLWSFLASQLICVTPSILFYFYKSQQATVARSKLC